MIRLTIKKTTNAALLASALLLTACNGGGGGYSGSGSGGYSSGGGSVVTSQTSSNVSVTSFVSALNNVDSSSNSSYVELYADETYRYLDEGLDDWFVIYDAKYDENKAVSLQYIRTIVYYDTMKDTNSLAAEFRGIETDDILDGDLNGDYFGDDYEVVDYDYGTDTFWGRNSGYEYEDEAETSDVRLMAANAEELKFFKKASQVSFEFSIGLPAAMTLVSLGQKIETMSAKGELSAEDFSVLATDMEQVTGVTHADIAKALADDTAKAQVMDTLADKLGTTAANIEQKLLPEFLGVSL